MQGEVSPGTRGGWVQGGSDLLADGPEPSRCSQTARASTSSAVHLPLLELLCLLMAVSIWLM